MLRHIRMSKGVGSGVHIPYREFKRTLCVENKVEPAGSHSSYLHAQRATVCKGEVASEAALACLCT